MSERPSDARRTWWLVSSLLIILIVAAVFRLWQIEAIPPGLFGDEAADGLDALDVLAGRGRVFFPGNFGREGLHMWIVALSLKLLGISPLAVRLPSVGAGLAAALAAFWLGYEMFVNRRGRPGAAPLVEPDPDLVAYLIPVLAALYMSTSFWHVHFSRFGIRGVFTTMTTALALAALWRALNTGRWRWFGVSGGFLGLGMHFYTASRFVPLLSTVFLALWTFLALRGVAEEERSGVYRRILIGFGIMVAAALLVFAPLGYYFLTHPGSFMQRANEVSAFQDGFSSGQLLTIARAAAANLMQFVVPGAGDQAQFYNLPGRAVFDPLTAVLALLGLGICLKRWRRPVYSFLIMWLLIMTLPSFIAVDRFPTLPRVLGVIPGVYFFPAIALAVSARWITGKLAERRILAVLAPAAVVILALLVHAGTTARDYFKIWGSSPATAEAFEADMTAAWRWLQANPPKGDVYLSSDLYKHPTFMFLHEQVPTTEYFTRQDPNLHWFDGRQALPLPDPAQRPTLLFGHSALPPEFITTLTGLELAPVTDDVLSQATIQALPALSSLVTFADQLTLLDQFVLQPDSLPDQTVIAQLWRVQGPAPPGWERLQLQSALLDATGAQLAQTSDLMHFHPAEWDQEGVLLLTWQALPRAPADAVRGTALRVVPVGSPPLAPPGSEDGWVRLPLHETGPWPDR